MSLPGCGFPVDVMIVTADKMGCPDVGGYQGEVLMIMQKVGVTLVFGVLWLFIFSIPVARNQRLFDLGFNVIVDTTPMNWVVTKVQSYFDMTKDMPAVEARLRGIDQKSQYARATESQIRE
jgi:hypothetical protein